MKKLLLTLGTAAVIATPLIAVVACERYDDSINVSYNGDLKSLSITNINVADTGEPQYYEDIAIAIISAVEANPLWVEAIQITLKGKWGVIELNRTVHINEIENNAEDAKPFIILEDLLAHTYTTHDGFSAKAILGKRIFDAPEYVPPTPEDDTEDGTDESN